MNSISINSNWKIGYFLAALSIMITVLCTAFAQTSSLSGWTLDFVVNDNLPPGFRQFKTSRKDGTMQTAFIVDINNCLAKRKPLMIFVDGSGAHSHFFVTPTGRRGTGVYGAIAMLPADEYHVIASDKRGVEFGYAGSNPGADVGAPAEYSRFATVEGRISEVRLLLDRMLREPMVDSSRVLLLGHSEGADVAAGAAAEDPRITHVAFLAGGGPTQMFDGMVSRRKEMIKNGRSPDQIENSIQELEENYRKIFADLDNETKILDGHSYRYWASFFSHPPMESILKTKAKLFLAHGTEDRAVPVESFDMLVVELIRHGCTNATIRRYPGRDHGLGYPGDRNSPPLGGVLEDVLEWARK